MGAGGPRFGPTPGPWQCLFAAGKPCGRSGQNFGHRIRLQHPSPLRFRDERAASGLCFVGFRFRRLVIWLRERDSVSQ